MVQNRRGGFSDDTANPRLPTLRQIEIYLAFLDAAEEGPVSLGALADQFDVSANAVKAHLKGLAASVGVATHVEQGRRWVATPEGRALRSSLQRYQTAAEAFTSTLVDERERSTYRLSCYAGHVHAIHGALGASFGQVRLTFRLLESFGPRGGPEAVDEILLHRSDLAIAAEMPEPFGISRVREPLYRWELLAVPSPGGPKLSTDCTPSGLVEHQLLVSPEGHQSRDLLDAAAIGDGVKLQYALETPATTARWYLSRCGLGTVIAPSDGLYLLQKRHKAVRVLDPYSNRPIGSAYYLYYRRDVADATTFVNLADSFRNAAKDWVEGQRGYSA